MKKIGIIGAMEVEIDTLRAAMSLASTKEISGMTFYEGTLDGVQIVLVRSGIGKVFASMAAEIMAVLYEVDALINTGVGGGIAEGLSIGEVVLATKLVQHDLDTSPLGDPVGLISGINVVYLPCDEALTKELFLAMDTLGYPHRRGIIASGDQFICDREKKDRIVSLFDASVCEMEGAAIAQVAYVNRIPCAVLRAISDNGNEEASVDYPTFVAQAAEKSANVLRAFLQKQTSDND